MAGKYVKRGRYAEPGFDLARFTNIIQDGLVFALVQSRKLGELRRALWAERRKKLKKDVKGDG